MMDEIKQSDRGRRQQKVGRVVSSKMDKTVVVAVERFGLHPLYRRQTKRTSKFYAHDEANECRVGDQVQIVSCRPLSRLKRWRVAAVLERGREA
ncbi:MAG: 30S ribosomal protein S17 [Thermoanaerobaculia bacterium]